MKLLKHLKLFGLSTIWLLLADCLLWAGPNAASPASAEGEASIVFRQAPPLWVIVLLIIPAIILITYLVYRNEKVSSPLRYILLFLRGILFFILVLILFQPVLSTEYTFRKESSLPILIDNSLSMGFSATGQAKPADQLTRIKNIERALFKPEPGKPDIIQKLAENYKVKLYTFGPSLNQFVTPSGGSTSFPELVAGGDSTAIGNALLDVLKDLSGHVTGIILISDGQNNTGLDPLEAAKLLKERGTECPIYAVAPAREEPINDIELADLKAPTAAIARDFVSFDLSARAVGFKEDQQVVVTLSESLLDESAPDQSHPITGLPAAPVAEETVTLPASAAKVAVSLKYKPTKPGKYIYTIKTPVLKGEIVTENNQLTHYINVVDHTIKILYVETYPRWEYRRLKNALIRDHSMKTAVLLLDADPEFPQESSPNVPPVYNFPQTKKELFGYDVIIWGDVDPARLGNSQAQVSQVIENIKLFVEEMSGGIAFISGSRYSPDNFRGTFMTELLPVSLEDQPYSLLALMREEDAIKEAFKMRLTPEGKDDPIMQLDPNPVINQRLWEDADGLPGLMWFYPAKKAKPGARVLAIHPLNRNKFGERPLIAVQYYGKGRTLFTAVDETWRWCLLAGDKYFYTFWGEALRWLRGKQLLGNKRYQIATDKPEYTLGEKVRIFARAYDDEFKPVAADNYPVSLSAPNSSGPGEVVLAASAKTGAYEGSYLPLNTGNYYLTLGPKSGSTDSAIQFGRENQSVISFSVKFPYREYENPAMNTGLLQALAQNTGGEFLYLDEIDQLAKKIKPSADIIYTETTEKDLWDTPLVFLVFLGVISAEWVIRKLVRLL